jgi:hypothetical protein
MLVYVWTTRLFYGAAGTRSSSGGILAELGQIRTLGEREEGKEYRSLLPSSDMNINKHGHWRWAGTRGSETKNNQRKEQ